MPGSPLAPLIDHEIWATRRLIEFARTLTPEQRAWTGPGTLGAIDRTLAHLVGAASYYVLRLTGQTAGDHDVEADDPIDLDELERWVDRMSESLHRFAAAPIEVGEIRERGSRRETVGTILAQLFHHGNEHRSQIGTILSAHGVEHPDYSGWAWGREGPQRTAP